MPVGLPGRVSFHLSNHMECRYRRGFDSNVLWSHHLPTACIQWSISFFNSPRTCQPSLHQRSYANPWPQDTCVTQQPSPELSHQFVFDLLLYQWQTSFGSSVLVGSPEVKQPICKILILTIDNLIGVGSPWVSPSWICSLAIFDRRHDKIYFAALHCNYSLSRQYLSSLTGLNKAFPCSIIWVLLSSTVYPAAGLRKWLPSHKWRTHCCTSLTLICHDGKHCSMRRYKLIPLSHTEWSRQICETNAKTHMWHLKPKQCSNKSYWNSHVLHRALESIFSSSK